MTDKEKKELFLRLVTEKMKTFAGKELFYEAFGRYCDRGKQAAQRWVREGRLPPGHEQRKKIWEFLGCELNDQGDISKTAELALEREELEMDIETVKEILSSPDERITLAARSQIAIWRDLLKIKKERKAG